MADGSSNEYFGLSNMALTRWRNQILCRCSAKYDQIYFHLFIANGEQYYRRK